MGIRNIKGWELVDTSGEFLSVLDRGVGHFGTTDGNIENFSEILYGEGSEARTQSELP